MAAEEGVSEYSGTLNVSPTAAGVVFSLTGSTLFAMSNLVIRKGLRLAGSRGLSAGDGGYSYLLEPTWWAGTACMLAGELANFFAYVFSPPTLVTPLGSFSSLVLTVMFSHLFTSDNLNVFGALGCLLAISGLSTMVLTVPEEQSVASVLEVWELAKKPGFVTYVAAVFLVLATLTCHAAPSHGSSNVLIYSSISAMVGALSIMAAKGLAIAVRLTLSGSNQFGHGLTYFFPLVIAASLLIQQNYTNKALDIFKGGLVIPINYIVFNVTTIAGYLILFQVSQTVVEVGSELCGFVTIVSGIFLIYSTKSMDTPPISGLLRCGLKPRSDSSRSNMPVHQHGRA